MPFERTAKVVLGEKFDLSLVFIGTSRSKTLNQKYRGKSYAANVLAFPISENSAEIFITLPLARAEAGKFGMIFEKFVFYLFIHALCHLKGFEHGSTMEREEKKILRKFKINVEKNRNRR